MNESRNLWEVIKSFFLRLEGPSFGAARSSQWSVVRDVFIKANPTCAVCGRKGSVLNPLNAHHIKSFATHPELELNPENLISACRIHHLWFCHLGNWASLNENIVEDAKIWHGKISTRPKWNGKEWVYLK